MIGVLLINDFNNENNWLKKINYLSKNFTKYEKIRLNAYNYANKFDLDWRVKKLLSFKKFSN